MFALRRLPISSLIQSSVRNLSAAPVTAQMVKKLRDTSGAPMMDCKKALGACDGDTEKAMDWLRAKGIARAASAAERVATEGLVGIFTDSRGTMLVEVNSETDFVGKNSDFHDFVGVVARAAAEYSSSEGGEAVTPEQLLAHNGGTIQNALGLAVASIRENIVIKRVAAVQSSPGDIMCSYVHGRVGGYETAAESLSLGKTAAVVSLHAPEAGEDARKQLQEHGRKVAMHVVAASPLYCLEEQVEEAFLARERAIMDEQMAADPKNAAKKPEILVKVREGKLRKRLSEVCLSSQPFVVEEGGPAVSKFLADQGKLLGCGSVTVTAFQRWGLGETTQAQAETPES